MDNVWANAVIAILSVLNSIIFNHVVCCAALNAKMIVVKTNG